MTSTPGKLLRLVALPVLLAIAPQLARAAESLEPPFVGRPVFEIIEHFRNQGYPFAYSSNLVPRSLLVLKEPSGHDPLQIVREILEPHSLALKQSDGIYLVIRGARGPPEEKTGTVLLIIRDQEFKLVDAPVALSGSPGLSAVEDLGAGIRQIKGLGTGSHEFNISVEGFIPLKRTVTLDSGDTVSLNVRLEPALTQLETLNVSTSRYVLFSNSQFFVDQRAIQNLPGNGEDPMRSVHRLPGSAAGGWSALTHFRGGEENESAIFLNGLKLIDPFHIRDFHNIFSSIDSRTISGVEAYTGGFPANYGDRMSGLLLLQSQKPEKPRKHELGISVFNTSILTSGYRPDGKVDWMFSARRSNLDLVLDRREHGNPDYHDMFGTLGFNASADTRFTFNFLRARDKVLVITEHISPEREQSTSDTSNQHFWVQVESQISQDLGVSAVLSSSLFRNTRNALAHDPEQIVASVFDYRKVDAHGIRADFRYFANDDHLVTFGAEARRESADYRYTAEAVYDGFYRAYPGVPVSLERDITRSPGGNSFAAYVSDRWQISPSLVLDSGLRWDKQTYIGPGNDDQISPRINLLYSPAPGLDLRMTWGRYHQSQQIQQLQVEDGVDHFFPSQQADHFILGSSIRLGTDWTLRVEAFDKKYSSLRPRYENLLDPVPLIAELEPDRIRVAPESGRSRGAEFTLEYEGHKSLNGWASYTLSRVTDRIAGRNQPRNWDQRHSLQAGMAWKKRQWEFGLAAKIHSGWPTTPASLAINPSGELRLVYGQRNSANLPTFINLDFRVSRKWQLPNSQLSAFFEISNFLDKQNECCVDYDAETDFDDLPPLERSVDHWLGASPAAGILWEF